MKCTSVLISLIFTVIGIPIPNCAQRVPGHILRQMPLRQGQIKSTAQFSSKAFHQVPVTAGHDVTLSQCPQEAQDLGGSCGYVLVPLDRLHPRGEQIGIYFEVYGHSNPGPAESAILVNFGGPGSGTTTNRDLALSLFAPNLDTHDLLLIDDRGRGLSNTIDCEELQHGTAQPLQHEIADCAHQLGSEASRFGTGDIVQDTDAVRAALGYDKVDYFGWSYGGEDVTAYATRFGEHLRSIVLDGPQGVPALGAFAVYFNTHAMPRLVSLDCLRSPTCSADHKAPNEELERLIRTVRQQPVEGYGHDPNGNLVWVSIDEEFLLNYLLGNQTGNFINIGELLAAASALENRDPTPLLRLGAESFFPLAADFGDPTVFSAAAAAATGCVDLYQTWAWAAPVEERERQYANAVAGLPSDYFDPFSKAAATDLPFSLFSKGCLWWEKPSRSSPVLPPHASYPTVPTLVLDGDMDVVVPLEETTRVASLFPSSSSFVVPEAGHGSFLWSACAANLESQFIENLHLDDSSCLSEPETIWPAVGRFPLVAASARPAEVDLTGGNEIGLAERKVVTLAVAAATDALQRSTIGSGDGVGLRAGTFHTEFGDTTSITLIDCAFAEDVLVSGSIVWGPDKSFVANLTVTGSGTAGGALQVEGVWQAPGVVGEFKISGTLGDRKVAVLVPEA
jgi:pimeloyl-ACP methyl ester carboxylesterase